MAVLQEAFVINGGKKLRGEIRLNGAKMAAPKQMVASLLTDEEVILDNFPLIGDTAITAELCRLVGSRINFSSGGASRIKLRTPKIKNHQVLSLSRRNRIPVLAMGPLLNRVGKAEVPLMGGDRIGPRPVNFHMEALMTMGAEIKENPGHSYQAEAPQGLRGARIRLPFPSVGATENIIMAAVLAKGKTIIQNAAIEPEIMDLIKLLQKMGAIIGLGANRVIYIEGIKRLHGARHYIIPDRFEAASFACLAVATAGKILVKEARQEDLITFLNALRRIGGEYEVSKEGITFWRGQELTATEVETDTHPGFMTDWQAPFVALLTQAKGVSVIHETIWEDRFGYVEDLQRMGANIQVFSKCLGELRCRFNSLGYNHSAVINGPTPLQAANVEMRDLRAGMVAVIAALMASGQSVITGVEEIDRGYYAIEARLRRLGASIRRIKIPNPKS